MVRSNALLDCTLTHDFQDPGRNSRRTLAKPANKCLLIAGVNFYHLCTDFHRSPVVSQTAQAAG